jgi:mRNA-degrading endonuclease RelE of RelBE toxin-antitoxin system
MADKIEKLFKKITAKERSILSGILQCLIAGEKKDLNIVKIVNSDLYRLKKGRFRIIFHYESKEVIVDSIRIRNEDTYKKLP